MIGDRISAEVLCFIFEIMCLINTVLTLPLRQTIENCWVEICKPKAKPLCIGCIYRAPDVLLDRGIELLKKILLDIPTNYEILLTGDFNIDYLTSNKTHQVCTQGRKLKHFGLSIDLEQSITIPTRVMESSK